MKIFITKQVDNTSTHQSRRG